MNYILQNPGEVWMLLWQHLFMTVIALLISTPLALFLALVIVHHKRLNTVIMGFLGILYTIPSIALIILLLPSASIRPRSSLPW